MRGVLSMKIALINENSQADKNELIYTELKRAAEKYGHEVDNYGMYSSRDKRQLTYVQNGLLASLLLVTGAADFVVTGCGTGEGAMLAANSFPGVLCGHVTSAQDAYLFGQINAGNAVSIPYAQNFGWGGELNLRYLFDKLFEEKFGGGYPKERVEAEQRNKKILDKVKAVSYRPLIDVLKDMDQMLLKTAIDDDFFRKTFYANCRDQEIAAYLKSL